MVLAAALLVLACELRGTETSSAGVLHTDTAMRYRLDEAHRQIDYSNNGGPWRSFTGNVWKIQSWDKEFVVVHADKGTAMFDLKAHTFNTHVIEHRGGVTIDQVAQATCKAM